MSKMKLGLLLPNQGVVFGAVTIKEMVEMAPEFVTLLESLPFAPVYAEIVTETPQDILDKAQAETG